VTQATGCISTSKVFSNDGVMYKFEWIGGDTVIISHDLLLDINRDLVQWDDDILLYGPFKLEPIELVPGGILFGRAK
jgi:hypothetical protein